MPTGYSCCDLRFNCLDCPMITGPDCIPPNNLLPGQMWYNPCTCTYYFGCSGGFDVEDNCGGFTPINHRAGAGIAYSGNCEEGSLISVRIQENGGLSFNGNGELLVTPVPVEPEPEMILPAVEKISYAVADATNDNVDESVMVGSTNSITISNPFPYPIRVVEQVHIAEVSLYNNSAYPASLGAMLERSADGVVWYPNSIGIRNPWISVQVGQAEELMGSLYNTVHTVPANSDLTVHLRCKRVVRSYSTAADRLVGLSVPFVHIECLMFQI